MKKVNNIKIWNLTGSVEPYTLQTNQNTIRLSDDLKDFEENLLSDLHLAINYLEYYNSHEPVTSWIIRHILAQLKTSVAWYKNSQRIVSHKKIKNANKSGLINLFCRKCLIL